MIEKIVMDYLTASIQVPAYMERPENPPVEYIIVEKTGSGKRNHVYTSTLAIQSYADTLYRAAALSELVRGAMEGIVALPELGGVREGSEYNFTNPADKQYRYQAVFTLYHY